MTEIDQETPIPDSTPSETPLQTESDLKNWFVYDQLKCLVCDYNLRGLVGPVVICPECGQHNDLTDPSPWRKKALPLGVQNPEHWPASAVGLAILIPAGLLISIALFLRGAGPPLLFIGFAGGTLFIIVRWLVLCRNWIHSCATERWGWLVLIILHGSAYLLLPVPTVILIRQSRPPQAWIAILPLLGLIGFFWGKILIDRADRRSAFRVDWRRWHLPLGEDDTEQNDLPFGGV